MKRLNEKWGFLRESTKKADVDKIKQDFDLPCTGLDEYLAAIFPNVDDWIHDRQLSKIYRKKPDYRSESLKLIIEFDGVGHYQNEQTIKDDEEKDKMYREYGYKVVRIPYFIQLTNDVIEKMFGVKMSQLMFDPQIPSFIIKDKTSKNTPKHMCTLGIRRMAKEFMKYPEQYKVNIEYLKSAGNASVTGWDMLEKEYNDLSRGKE